MVEFLAESWPLLVALLGLLGLSAFFSSSETALFSLGAGSLGAMARERPRTARRVEALLARRRRLLVTILLGNLVVNVAYFNLGRVVGDRVGVLVPWASWVTAPLVVLGILVCGEVIPKMFAVRFPTVIAGLACWPLTALERLLAIPRSVLAAIAAGLARLVLGTRPEEGAIDALELQALLEAAVKEGALARDENLRLQAVLEFDQVRVNEVMSPRVEVAALSLGCSREELLAHARQSGRSKIVLFEKSLDDARSFVDALELLGREGIPPAEVLQPLVFVPETARVMDLLERFRREGLHLAIVVDEYGGTEGVVTREDLVEAIVGDLADEGDSHAELVTRDGSAWLVSGGIGLKAFGRLFGARGDQLGVETVGGWMAAELGRLPRVGDRVRSSGLAFEVVEMKGLRLERVRVRAIEMEQAA